jgi:hypothetical protein
VRHICSDACRSETGKGRDCGNGDCVGHGLQPMVRFGYRSSATMNRGSGVLPPTGPSVSLVPCSLA